MVVAQLSTSSSCDDPRRLCECLRSQQRGAVVTLMVTVLMVVALLFLMGPYELARVTWLLSQSFLGCFDGVCSQVRDMP